MGKLTLVTGGVRSGKSKFAESLFSQEKDKIYLATAIAFDNDMRDRISHHKASRSKDWITIEHPKNFKNLNLLSDFTHSKNILLECLTLFINNCLFDKDIDWDKIDSNSKKEIEEEIFRDLKDLLELTKNKNLVIVTNEVGLGIVPDNSLAIFYRDLSGRLNQYLAQQADQVYMTVSGIPLKIKGE